MTYDEKIKKVRTARNILSKLEDRGILENNLTEEQITAIRIAEYALDELWKSKEGQPVKRGKWDGYICSECNVCADYFISGDFYFDEKPNFCPNCGVRMDIIYEDDKIRAIKVTGWNNYYGECDAKMDGDSE